MTKQMAQNRFSVMNGDHLEVAPVTLPEATAGSALDGKVEATVPQPPSNKLIWNMPKRVFWTLAGVLTLVLLASIGISVGVSKTIVNQTQSLVPFRSNNKFWLPTAQPRE